jgi:hypothetical protein
MAIRRSNDPRGSTTPAASAAPETRSSTAPPRPRPAPVEEVAKKPSGVSADARRAMIAESAYLRSERRGFTPGFEEEDWLAAEKEIDALLSARAGARQ